MNKSLKDNTGEKDKINDIRLSLNTPKGSQTIWVLVEGEDDCKIKPRVKLSISTEERKGL